MEMTAANVLRANIVELLEIHHQQQTDLAQWCKHSDAWLSAFLRGERDIPLKDLDRIADLWGLATYQLFQPGVSRRTERRSGADRRQARERRIGAKVREMKDLQAAITPARRAGLELSAQERDLLERLRTLPQPAIAGLLQIVGITPKSRSRTAGRTKKS